MISAEQNKRAMENLITRANEITGKSDTDLTNGVNSLIEGYGQGGITEVSTEAEMMALLETAEVGSIYKYMGESTDIYESRALYIVEESE